MIAREFREHLERDIIPFWNRLKDEKNGGFCGHVSAAGVPDWEADKGGILNSRILWFYAAAYLLLGKPELLEMAEHAYLFLRENFYDEEFGGVYWSVRSDGTLSDGTKHTYNQAFAIYALAAYYRASGDEKALELAFVLYRLIEEKCRDEGGYLEAFHRDFTPDSNEKLSENGVMAERTMNTLLHVMEAYTGLYQAKPDPKVGDSLREILDLCLEKMYNPEKMILEVFFDHAYRPLIDLESYGHDIEASWLISRACDVLGDETYRDRMREVVFGLAEGAYLHGIDSSVGAMNNECERGVADRQKIWWVQAETVTGFFNAYQLAPEKTEYLEIAEKTWKYIQDKVIDRASGEWIESIPAEGEPDPNQPLVRLWKCPYHNGRMCMEMIERLEQSQA